MILSTSQTVVNRKGSSADQRGEAPEYALPVMPCGALLHKYPERRPPLIDGLLRTGETMNIIAAPKIGKSWLSLGLAFSVATGRSWLSRFSTTQGNVLLIDNELHPETIAHRLRTLVQALNWPMEEIAETLSIVSLRGRLADLFKLGTGLKTIPRGRFSLVLLDAFYRTMPMGRDENDNASMAELYNLIDCYADSMGAAFVNIHHASKGNQSSKAVTDVGSGAGAQSRATDTHLILRPHEENDVVVLDAAARSFPPLDSLCLRWNFPTWNPAPDLDPTALRPERPRRPKPAQGENPVKPAEPPWTAKRFAEEFGKPEPQARGVILEKATEIGLSDRKATDLLKRAIECGNLHSWSEKGANSKTWVSTLPRPEPLTPVDPEPSPVPEKSPTLETIAPPDETPPAKKKPSSKRRQKKRK